MNASEKRNWFRQLHVKGAPLLMPNPADAGQAKVLADTGFAALATTSGGYAATLGRFDYGVTRDEAVGHAITIVDAVDVPVSADMENGFGASPVDVVATVDAALAIGLAGCSIEDFTTDSDDPIYGLGAAKERIAAAVEAARSGPGEPLVISARAENYLHGRRDLAPTIERLQAFQEVGADVLYAPGMTDLGEIAALVREVDRPVNVLLMPGGPSPSELAAAGVARISVGSGFQNVMLGALARAGAQLLAGSTEWMELAGAGRKAITSAFSPP